MNLSLQTREILDIGYWLAVIYCFVLIYVLATNGYSHYVIYVVPFLLILAFLLICNNKKGLELLKEKKNEQDE